MCYLSSYCPEADSDTGIWMLVEKWKKWDREEKAMNKGDVIKQGAIVGNQSLILLGKFWDTV